MRAIKMITFIITVLLILATCIGCGTSEPKEVPDFLEEKAESEPDDEETEPKNDSITIILDPGHGGENTGATADVNGNGMIEYEKDLNMIVANYMLEILGHYEGLHVTLTRYGDEDISHEERAEIAKLFAKETWSKTVVMISIHNNANPHTNAEGVEAFVSVFDEKYDWIATDLAYEMVDGISDNFELLNRGVFTRVGRRHNDWYGIIRNGIARGVPVIILEQCFMDNPDDALKVLSSNEKLHKLAETNVRSIVDFFRLALD